MVYVGRILAAWDAPYKVFVFCALRKNVDILSFCRNPHPIRKCFVKWMFPKREGSYKNRVVVIRVPISY